MSSINWHIAILSGMFISRKILHPIQSISNTAKEIQIIDRFYRVDKSRSKETGGTGLGLSIAHWIAEQHDITIQIESNSGEGTSIIIKIPLLSSAR